MGQEQRDKFVNLTSRSALILGEHSTDGGAQGSSYMRNISRDLLPIFHIPTTYHHLMFDEPMAVVAALTGILLNWVREDHATELRAAFDLTPEGGVRASTPSERPHPPPEPLQS